MARHKALARGPVDRLPTARERQVAQMIADGLSNEDIASKLKIATKTVEAHRANLYKKLGVGNTAQLIQVGVQGKWIKMRGVQVA